ncbi:MAG TPA: N,N-dimethylformamidase beta subunit family domain-containing protein [Candidatus Nitrosopolaris sp.]|nr:N,N-dimethylformamidase beta subunit family domain-containing protein [Candidatus Nitrosopolaris sp.]
MSIILLTAFLETILFINLNLPTLSLIPLDHLAYAQNTTLGEGKSNSGTGIGTSTTNITIESDLPDAVSGHVSLPKFQQFQMLKIKQHQNQVPLIWLGSHSQSNPHAKASAIALVVPIFTGAAYNDAFYIFYKRYSGVRAGENVTRNLYLLSSVVTKPKVSHFADIDASAFAMSYLAKHLSLLMPKNNVSVLTDINVDGGSIFMDNKHTTNRYDILILGHQEYVTQQEYTNLKTFVANGGTMILLDGNVFYAQVGYDRSTHTITLLKGHGWAFNGKTAWKSVGERWRNETSEWVGSNFLCVGCKMTFANNPFGYNHHEEEYVTNPDDIILLNYNVSITSPNPKVVKNATSAHEHTVAVYELNYRKGRVIGLGMYSDDVIDHHNFLVFLDHLLMAINQNKMNDL